MGRQKIRTQRIEDDKSRSVTFRKRKDGLMKKAMELSILCEARVAMVIFNERGQLFEYASTTPQEVIGEYLCQAPLQEGHDIRNNDHYIEVSNKRCPPDQRRDYRPAPRPVPLSLEDIHSLVARAEEASAGNQGPQSRRRRPTPASRKAAPPPPPPLPLSSSHGFGGGGGGGRTMPLRGAKARAVEALQGLSNEGGELEEQEDGEEQQEEEEERDDERSDSLGILTQAAGASFGGFGGSRRLNIQTPNHRANSAFSGVPPSSSASSSSASSSVSSSLVASRQRTAADMLGTAGGDTPEAFARGAAPNQMIPGYMYQDATGAISFLTNSPLHTGAPQFPGPPPPPPPPTPPSSSSQQAEEEEEEGGSGRGRRRMRSEVGDEMGDEGEEGTARSGAEHSNGRPAGKRPHNLAPLPVPASQNSFPPGMMSFRITPGGNSMVEGPNMGMNRASFFSPASPSAGVSTSDFASNISGYSYSLEALFSPGGTPVGEAPGMFPSSFPMKREGDRS